jgi:hypothetical protein
MVILKSVGPLYDPNVYLNKYTYVKLALQYVLQIVVVKHMTFFFTELALNVTKECKNEQKWLSNINYKLCLFNVL